MNILPLGMNGLEPINPKKKKKFIFTQIQKNIFKNSVFAIFFLPIYTNSSTDLQNN